MRKALIAAGALALAAMTAGATSAQPQQSQWRPPRGPECLRSSDWRGWKVTPDGKAIYIDAGINRVWRFDLVQQCRELKQVNARIFSVTRTAWLCRPIDVNMRVVVPPGMVTPCMVKTMRRLSPAEIKALPRELRP